MQDISSGKLTRESEDDCACEGMFELDKAFKQIEDVMTSLKERSSDSNMSNDERDEIVWNLSRSLWNLHMARHYVGKMIEENKSLNLASAPRSTEIVLSHGHATTNEEGIKGTMVPVIKEDEGTMVPRAEVNIVNGQYERNVYDAITDNIESDLHEVKERDSIESETLQSVSVRTLPMGSFDVPFQEDSSDLGSFS